MTQSPNDQPHTKQQKHKNISMHDPEKFGKVAVVYGGNSNERIISLASGDAVLKALTAKGVDAIHFDPQNQDVSKLKTFDRVFNVLHGRGGEDGQLQGLLEWFGVPQTGSGVLASAIGMDKVRTKQLWQGCGLPTAPFAILTQDSNWEDVVATLGLTLMIKPVHEGSSIGMSKVETLDELPKAYHHAADCGDVVMAEKFITGSEYTVVILDNEAYPVIRLQPAETSTFFDFEAKYERNDTGYYIPCGLTEDEEAKLQDISVKAFKAVGAFGWGRIDAMRDENGNFWLLEINTVPGMTSHSLVPMAVKAGGIEFDQLCWHILSQTL